ncbi:hypothetical protein [Gimesia maris]|uniref:hypothetical protein n=1 Tax=Gimesia maris TaxID=122 RepID=UPI001E5EF921|nr:hypothetical protein [Gimesia maris]
MKAAQLLALIWILIPALGCAQSEPAKPEYFNQRVTDSNPLRTEQARELDEYIKTIAADRRRFEQLFQPDYSSAAAFEKAAEPLRAAFCESIGYPPPVNGPISLPPIKRSVKTASAFTIVQCFRFCRTCIPKESSLSPDRRKGKRR